MDSGKVFEKKPMQQVCPVKGTVSLNEMIQSSDEEQTMKCPSSRSLCNFQGKQADMFEESNSVQFGSMLEYNDVINVNNNDEIVSLDGVHIGVIKEDSEMEFAKHEAFENGSEYMENVEKVLSKADGEECADLICRICHDNPSDKPFIRPCSCKGSMGQVHQDCLEHWLTESAKTSCEICGFEYILNRKPKYTGIQSVFAWIKNPTSPNDIKNLFFDMACFLVLTPLATFTAWLCILGSDHYSTTPKPDSPIEHRYGNRLDKASNSRWTKIGFLSITLCLLSGFYVWLFLAFMYHYNIWKVWQERNCIVEVIPIPIPSSEAHGNNSTDDTEALDDSSFSDSDTTPIIRSHTETSSGYTLSSVVIQIQPDLDNDETEKALMGTSFGLKE